MGKFIESEHPRDNSGKFTSKFEAICLKIIDTCNKTAEFCNEEIVKLHNIAKDYLPKRFFERVDNDLDSNIIFGVTCAAISISKHVDGLPMMSRLVDIAPCKDKKGRSILSSMNKKTADTMYFCSARIKEFEDSCKDNDKDRLNGRLPFNVCRDTGRSYADYAFHEYGHYLLIWSRMHDAVTDVMKESDKNGTIPSRYARKDEDEFFAEIFTVYFQDRSKLTVKQRELVERVMNKANAVFKGMLRLHKGVLMAGLDEETVAGSGKVEYPKKDYDPIIEIVFRNMHAEYDVPLNYAIKDKGLREAIADYDRGDMVVEANIRDLKEFIKTCKDPGLIRRAKEEIESFEDILNSNIRY